MRRVTLIFFFMALSLGLSAQEVRDTVVVTDDWQYEGQWPKGEGVLYHKYNGVYWGEFDRAVPVICKHCNFYGERYYGNFQSWKKNGKGIRFLTSGAVYDGYFSEGDMTGVGVLYSDGVSIRQGEFLKGRLIIGKEYNVSPEKMNEMRPIFPEEDMTPDIKKYLKIGMKKTRGPMFQGGDMNNFSKWVNSNLRYPLRSKENGETGTVILSFVVKEDGNIAEVEIVSSSSYADLDKEALRVVSSAPKFRPALLNGNKVSKRYTSFPIIFYMR